MRSRFPWAFIFIILCVVGRVTLARSNTIDSQQPIEVSVIRTIDDAQPPKPQQAKPIPTPIRTVVTPVTPEVQTPPPTRAPIPFIQRFFPSTPKPAATPRQRPSAYKPAGNPGGALNTGSTSSHGQNLGTSGRTPWLRFTGAQYGKGAGSGSGEGVGRPEPVRNAVDGPGREAAPAPPPPADVRVKVCAESGMIPGPYCESTITRSYRPGREPTAVCNVCRPKHKSVLADRSVPELISGPRSPRYPIQARDDGVQGTVVVEFTINEEGSVVSVKIVSSSGHGDLDDAAVDTVRARKYKPAVQAGIPRSYRKRETFRFTLD